MALDWIWLNVLPLIYDKAETINVYLTICMSIRVDDFQLAGQLNYFT